MVRLSKNLIETKERASIRQLWRHLLASNSIIYLSTSSSAGNRLRTSRKKATKRRGLSLAGAGSRIKGTRDNGEVRFWLMSHRLGNEPAEIKSKSFKTMKCFLTLKSKQFRRQAMNEQRHCTRWEHPTSWSYLHFRSRTRATQTRKTARTVFSARHSWDPRPPQLTISITKTLKSVISPLQTQLQSL